MTLINPLAISQDKERLEQLLARAQQAAEDAYCDATRANASAADARAQLAAQPVVSHCNSQHS